MAWLIQTSNRMEEDSLKVQAFLATHDLERFQALLADAPGNPSSSLEALRRCSEAELEAAGLPQSPRLRLLQALRASEPQHEKASPAAASPPAAARPVAQWTCLGKAPPGWRSMHEIQQPRKESVVLVDAAIGGTSDAEEAEEDEEFEEFARPQEPLLRPVSQPVETFRQTRSATPLGSVRPSSASGDKVCCYECFRQVHRNGAVALSKHYFCSDACSESFAKACEEREKRERHLGELRNAVLAANGAGSVGET